jgi:F0F1-type ATP synthase assembly protein I
MARSPLDPQRSTIGILQSVAVASYFGVSLAISVVLGFLAGQWLDGHLNTGYIFTLIGVLLGLVAATTSGVRVYRATLRKSGAGSRAQTQTTESAPDDDDAPTA